ncbi:MAG TPA: beta-ketoacyl synthase N-terminal-like domain-containing protein [Polyangia bacterium]
MSSRGKRVAVTGMGLRSPLGHTPAALRDGLLAGRSGIRTMADWGGLDGLRTRVGAPCDGIDASEIPRKYSRTMGRVAVLSALSVRDAIADAGLPSDVIASPSCGVAFGSTVGSTAAQEEFLRPILNEGTIRGILASTYLQFMSHTCAANIAMMFGCKGPVIASCTACTSGSQGVGIAYEQVRFGRVPICLGGGAEELHVLHAGIFDIMRATSAGYAETPDRTPRPFDRWRDGLVVGEGAACLVLEEYEHARRRGATIHAEIIGYGQGCNGTHPTNSDPDGICIAVGAALRDAELAPSDIDHINAHATGTDVGDAAEAVAVHRIFGAKVPVSALKGYLSHTLGASGAIESVASIMMMKDGFMAVSKNLDEPDPALPPLDHVLGSARQTPIKIAMNNNFAFGGINTSLIFRTPS